MPYLASPGQRCAFPPIATEPKISSMMRRIPPGPCPAVEFRHVDRREVQMFRIQAPILVIPTTEAKIAVGADLQAAGLAAYREIAMAAKGLEIAYLQFVFHRLSLAVCSRIRRD